MGARMRHFYLIPTVRQRILEGEIRSAVHPSLQLDRSWSPASTLRRYCEHVVNRDRIIYLRRLGQNISSASDGVILDLDMLEQLGDRCGFRSESQSWSKTTETPVAVIPCGLSFNLQSSRFVRAYARALTRADVDSILASMTSRVCPQDRDLDRDCLRNWAV
jgi:hypothetical protein